MNYNIILKIKIYNLSHHSCRFLVVLYIGYVGRYINFILQFIRGLEL